jgi:hypothetical protein
MAIMKRLSWMCAFAVTALAGAAYAQPTTEPFRTCQDAKNYGSNSSRLLVSQVINRTGCDAQRAHDALTVLAGVVSEAVIGTAASDDMLVCYHEGYFAGLLRALDDEYVDCSDRAGFECIPGATIGMFAGATWVALSQNQASAPSESVISRVFNNSAQRACRPSRTECSSAVSRFLSDNDLWSLVDGRRAADVKHGACRYYQ